MYGPKDGSTFWCLLKVRVASPAGASQPGNGQQIGPWADSYSVGERSRSIGQVSPTGFSLSLVLFRSAVAQDVDFIWM